MGLHRRYARILGDDASQTLAAPDDSMRERLAGKFRDMMKALYTQRGAELDVEFIRDPAVTGFIDAHTSVLDSACAGAGISDSMRRSISSSNYIFSGLKTFHELNEAFPSITDPDGSIKPFERFLNDVQSIDGTYNRNYLRAEYNFVTRSAQMAAKWEEYAADGDDYYIQYRTQADDRVRSEHAVLNRITLPPSDPFWNLYTPPNGWNCRCDIVQVRKSKYTATDPMEAAALGAQALGGDRKGIFSFNPGKERKAIPDYNPYTIRRCRDCDIAKGGKPSSGSLARFVPDNELCAACRLIRQIQRSNGKIDSLRANIRDAQKSLTDHYKTLLPEVRVGKFKAKRLEVKATDESLVIINKNFYEETKSKYRNDSLYLLKLGYAKNAHKYIQQAKFVREEAADDHPDSIFKVYMYEDDCYLVEMKVKCNGDGNILHILRIYPK